MIALLASETVIMSTGDDGDRLLELMSIGALNLGQHSLIQGLEVFSL